MQDLFKQLTDDEREDLNRFLEDAYKTYTLPRDLGVVEVVVEGERDDSIRFNVFKWDNRLWRHDGHYDSWNGTDWEGADSIYEVEAKDITVTTYPKK